MLPFDPFACGSPKGLPAPLWSREALHAEGYGGFDWKARSVKMEEGPLLFCRPKGYCHFRFGLSRGDVENRDSAMQRILAKGLAAVKRGSVR